MAALFTTPKAPRAPEPVREPEPIDGEAAARAAAQAEREKALLRRLRGRAGTIATSPRGILREGPLAPRRRSLLGE